MNVTIIGVPYDLDQPSIAKGKAPAALLDAGLAQRLGAAGSAATSIELVATPDSAEPREVRLGRVLAAVGQAVGRARETGSFPLVIGGDCTVVLGVLAGLADPANTAVVWLDAHGDFNTPETTISGYLGGMPLACAVGRGLEDLRVRSGLPAPVPERNVALVGVRDLDPLEERALAGSAVTVVRAGELNGHTGALDHVLRTLGELPQLYLHIDVDVLDPAEAPGVDYPAARGLRLAELQAIVQRVIGMGNLAALALTAVNPEKDTDSRTVQVGLDVIESALAVLFQQARR